MKKLTSLLLVVIMVFSMFSLVACPNNSTTTTTTTKDDTPVIDGTEFEDALLFQLADGETYDGSEVTIEFSHTMGENLRNVLDDYIKEFNKIYPNITIVHSQVGGYDDVRDTVSKQILAGTQPNIAYCYPDHVALYNLAKAAVPLDQFIEHADLGLTQDQIDDFIDAYWDEGRCYGDGIMYTLPLSKSTEVLYYNKTYFDQHNLTVPTTWDDLANVCRQIIAIEKNNNCIPLGYDSEANWFITMCEQIGSDYTSATGTKYLFNNAENKAFVEKFASWYYEGLLTTQEIFKAYTSGMFVQQDKTKTYSYMSIGSSAGATHQRPTKDGDSYPFEVGIAPIPQQDPSNPKVISQGPSLVILNNENRQEVIASWLFVKYLTTTIEFQAEFSMVSGYIPVLESVMENETYKTEFLDKADGGDNIAALSVKQGLEQRNAYYVSPAFTGSSVARDEVGNLLQNVFINYGTHYLEGTTAKLIDDMFKNAIAACERKYPSPKQ